MSSPPIDITTKRIIGFESYWDIEPAIIGQDIIVLTRDTDIFKCGTGDKTFHELPVRLNVHTISDIINNLTYIDITFDDLDEDRLATINNSGKIDRTGMLDTTFDKLYRSIYDNSLFVPIFINGPNKGYINASITLSLEGFSAYNKTHRYDDASSIWKLSYDPDNIITSSTNKLTINLPNDSSYIGQTITITGKLVDKLGNISQSITHDILITSSELDGYVTNTNLIIEGNSPIISSYSWNNDNHKINKSYALTIEIDDIEANDNSVLSVICNNINVSIVKDAYSNNRYIITYPNFTHNTDVLFTISLVNIYGYKDIKQFTKHVTL